MDKQTPVTRGEIPESLDYLSPESRRGGGVFLPIYYMYLYSIYLFFIPSYFTRARIFGAQESIPRNQFRKPT